MRKLITFLLLVIAATAIAQSPININSLRWLPDSHDFWVNEKDGLYLYNADNLGDKKLFLSNEVIHKAGLNTPVEDIVWSQDRKTILLYTNSSRVWRANTKGDYWYFELASGKGRQIGKGLPSSSLQFAKFSPDNSKLAYVSRHNLYMEEARTGKITQLTKDGTDRIINGTFDWAYEEELGIRDGFSWNASGTSIAFWRTDASSVKFHLMINNTDSIYPFIKPVEYPVAGEPPSSVKIGVINILTKKTVWMQVPGDPANNYIPRMDWATGSEIMILQLNRLQNEAHYYICNSVTGKVNKIFDEKVENGWIQPFNPLDWDAPWWIWTKDHKYFLRAKEKDGWLHVFKISRDGKEEKLLTRGAYDGDLLAFNESTGDVFFSATPYDATQRYLYKVNIDGSDTVRVTPAVFDGTNNYTFAPDGAYALHLNANIHRSFNSRLVHLPDHKKVYPVEEDKFTAPKGNFDLSKFKVKTVDGIEMDGIMARPKDFDSTKKYPVFFFVYGEPASSVANDMPTFTGHIAALIPKGYIGIAMDNRGTPVMKGTAWRMAIYKKLGIVNARDQAMAATEILKWKFIDTSRVAVYGHSGGGAMTLNLMFRYPEIYKTGVAASAVTDQRFYDNIYTERFMGLPQDDPEAYRQSSPITFAKNLKGNLLYLHGTGDDNVHYKNAENLFNELIKNGKLFQMMIYPNRTHGIFEGEGTVQHVRATFIKFIEEHSPPGAR